MDKIEPYWNSAEGLNNFIFSIKKVERSGFTDFSEVPPTKLPFFTFTYLTEGEVLLEIEGKTYLCQPGKMVIIPQKIPFRVLHFKGNAGYECGFSLRMLKDLSYECLHNPQPLLQSFQGQEATFTTLLLDQLLKAYRDKDYRVITSALDLFLCRLQPPKDHPSNATVAHFLEIVFDRSRKPGKVSDYADELCITPNYLNRLVRNQTHHSAMDWIEISRINLAKSLLKQNELQISEIAAATGIDDQSYFTRFFKKNAGCTPSQYRDTVLKSTKEKQ